MRQQRSARFRPLETRIKRLDEQIAKLTAQKKSIDAQLAEPSIYDEANKEKLKTLMLDQAYADSALDFFLSCRDSMKASAKEMAIWILQATVLSRTYAR